MTRPPRRIRPVALLLAVVALGATACGGVSDDGGSGGGDRLTLVAYSTPQEAYEEIIPAFAKTPEGRGVGFDQSYGSSGEQARAVESGLPSDVVALSLEPDMQKLVDAGLVDAGWNKDATRGNVTNSVAVFAVRKDNPKNIRTWNDLVRDDIEVITPNPVTSGGARWNIMAAFGSQTTIGRSEAEGIAFLRDLLANVSVQDKSAREALQTFTAGKGDVLIAYENEAITAQQKGQEIDYVIPDETILIENPVAVVKDSRKPEQARAFVNYLRSPEAQGVFAEKGYRSVDESLVDEATYPTPSGLFTIADVGGWPAVVEKFFDDQNGVVTKINEELGVPSE